MLFQCEKIKPIWSHITDLFRKQYKLNERKIVLNDLAEPINHIANFVVLITKYAIFQCKCLNITASFQYVLKEIMFYLNLEQGLIKTLKKTECT